MLERHPELAGRVVFVQLAVPSRTGIDEYERARCWPSRTTPRPLASALHEALHMPSNERRNRLRGLQSHLERNDVRAAAR